MLKFWLWGWRDVLFRNLDCFEVGVLPSSGDLGYYVYRCRYIHLYILYLYLDACIYMYMVFGWGDHSGST